MNKDFLGWLIITVVMAFYFIIGKIIVLRLDTVYFSLFTIFIAIVLTIYMFSSEDKHETGKTDEIEYIKIE
jgi:ABC-type branched-subunit amino acid transport system permease subunit